MREKHRDLPVLERLKYGTATSKEFPCQCGHGKCKDSCPCSSKWEKLEEQLIPLYFEVRANGDNSCSPNHPFPNDGRYAYAYADQDAYVKNPSLGCMLYYNEGKQDRVWMEERDKNYVRSLARKGVLHKYIEDDPLLEEMGEAEKDGSIWRPDPLLGRMGKTEDRENGSRWRRALQSAILEASYDGSVTEIEYYFKPQMSVQKVKNCLGAIGARFGSSRETASYWTLKASLDDYFVTPSLLAFAHFTKQQLRDIIQKQCTTTKKLEARVDDAIGSDDESDALPADFQSLKIHRGKWKRIDQERLGQGSIGIVHAGRLSRDDQQIDVAIKSIPGDLLTVDQQTQPQSFLREMQLLKCIQSQQSAKHVLGLFGVTLHRNRRTGQKSCSLILERGECTLAVYLDQKRKAGECLSIQEKYQLVLDVLEGVNAVHQLNMVHRDIKDTNIILVREGTQLRAKIADFGVGQLKEANSIQTTRSVSLTSEKVGTELWQAPELLKRVPHNQQSDMYSVALVLWRIVSDGEALFVTNNAERLKRLPLNFTELYSLYSEDYFPGRPTCLVGADHTHPLYAIWEIIQKSFITTHRFSRTVGEATQHAELLPGNKRPTAEDAITRIKNEIAVNQPALSCS